MNALLDGISESEIVNVMGYTFVKVIFDKMSSYIERDNKVKKDKLQGYRMQFDSLNMHDDENIAK